MLVSSWLRRGIVSSGRESTGTAMAYRCVAIRGRADVVVATARTTPTTTSSSSSSSTRSSKSKNTHNTTTATSDQPSNRKKFKQIVPDQRIVDYLDAHQLGFCAKRKARVALARKFADTATRQQQGQQGQQGPPVKAQRVRGVLDQTFLGQRFKESPYPFDQPGRLLTAAGSSADIPAFDFHAPQVAMVGRSNVGKSTLLNALIGMEAADAWAARASVSDKPGETRMLHFYGVGRGREAGTDTVTVAAAADREVVADTASGAVLDTVADTVSGTGHREIRDRRHDGDGDRSASLARVRARVHVHDAPPALVVTDMPGFGFAFMSEADAARCSELTRSYLLPTVAQAASSSMVRCVLLLVDARHGLKMTDETYLESLFNDSRDGSDGSSSGGRDIREGNTASGTSSSVAQSAVRRRVRWRLQLVLTKADLVDRFDLARRLALAQDRLQQVVRRCGNPVPVLPPLAVSSTDYRGLLHLKRELAKLLPAESSGTSDAQSAVRTTARVPVVTGTSSSSAVRCWQPPTTADPRAARASSSEEEANRRSTRAKGKFPYRKSDTWTTDDAPPPRHAAPQRPAPSPRRSSSTRPSTPASPERKVKRPRHVPRTWSRGMVDVGGDSDGPGNVNGKGKGRGTGSDVGGGGRDGGRGREMEAALAQQEEGATGRGRGRWRGRGRGMKEGYDVDVDVDADGGREEESEEAWRGQRGRSRDSRGPGSKSKSRSESVYDGGVDRGKKAPRTDRKRDRGAEGPFPASASASASAQQPSRRGVKREGVQRRANKVQRRANRAKGAREKEAAGHAPHT